MVSRTPSGTLAFYLGWGAWVWCSSPLFGAEGIRQFGLMAPELIPWFLAFDVSAFLEVLLLGAAVGARGGLRTLRSEVGRKLRRIRALTSSRALRPEQAS